MRKKGSLLLLPLFLVLSFSTPNTQQNVSIVVEAQPQQWLRLRIDGTDPGWGPTTNEACDLGNVDARGAPISGASSGHPDVNGVAGIPVSSSGVPLASPNDPNSTGSFYPLFSATGGNILNRHPNSALVIRISASERWHVLAQTQLTIHTNNVTIGQLKWKDDSTPSNGSQGYTDFTSTDTLLASGGPVVFRSLYHDYGLLVEYEDEPGTNVWSVVYTLTSV